MRKCKYLSNPIYVDPENILKYVDEQYVKFIEDFVNNTTYFEGLPIIVKHEKDNKNYGELLNNSKYTKTSFAHIITKQVNQNLPDRSLDIKRLRTCRWVKELIDYANNLNSSCNQCQFQKNKVLIERKQDITYIFCQNVRYVVILQKIRTKNKEYYIIKTAYYVDQDYGYRNLMKKLQ